MTERKSKYTILNFIFLLILLLYPLRHIWLGVELTDSAYSAGNYRFSEQINSMWFFSTFLANVMGKALSALPGGNTLMGLNGYTALIISGIAVAMYVFLTKMVKMPPVIAFVGEVLAISLCWCPTTILYNYLTYFCFNIAVIVLYIGLIREKRLLLFLAGILLGINVLVRFPNLAEAALIVCLWYYGCLQHKRIKDIFKETGICILGYFAGIGSIMVGIAATYGITEYVDGIIRLMNMPSDASDYSLYSMILTVLLDYKASSRWLLCMVFLVLAGGMVSYVAGKTKAGQKNGIRILGKALFLFAILCMLRWWYSLGVFNIKYYTYESMFQWVAVYLIVTILICVIIILWRNETVTRNERLLAGIVLVVIAVTPLGSNNHLYPNMNNMFIVFPFTLHVLWKWIKRLKEKEIEKYSLFPLQAMLSVFLAAVMLQSFLFGVVFTFRDGMSGQKRDTQIVHNEVLKGMVTNRELAQAIEELTVFVKEQDLTEKELILYGQIPATSYILDMPSAISTTWPDLRSYAYGTMVEDIERVKADMEDAPMIVLGAGLDGFYRGDDAAMLAAELTDGEKAAYETDAKWKLLTDFMNQYEYKRIFGNAKFAIYAK